MHKRGGGSGGEKYQGGGKKGNPMENRRRISFFLDFSLTLANSFESNPMGWRRRQKRQNGNHHHWVLKMDGGGEFFEPTIGYAVGTAQTLALYIDIDIYPPPRLELAEVPTAFLDLRLLGLPLYNSTSP